MTTFSHPLDRPIPKDTPKYSDVESGRNRLNSVVLPGFPSFIRCRFSTRGSPLSFVYPVGETLRRGSSKKSIHDSNKGKRPRIWYCSGEDFIRTPFPG